MFDMHYDLLSIVYKDYLSGNFQTTKQQCQCYRDDNVKGVVANLYFMSKEEMQQELHEKYYQENVSVREMFKIAKRHCTKYLSNSTLVLYSIEGCDYIKDTVELEQLYQEGLRSIILTWNEKSKYGSGNRSEAGLTDLGRIFLRKAIDLGIGIDLSHANEKTFYDMIEVIEEQQMLGKKVVCYASHSNVKALCNRSRNLSDDQLYALKKVGALVGIMSLKNFVTLNKAVSEKHIKELYLDQISYVKNIWNDTSHIVLSTDDMNFLSEVDKEYGKGNLFHYTSITNELKELLKQRFTDEEIDQMLFLNAKEQIYDKLI